MTRRGRAAALSAVLIAALAIVPVTPATAAPSTDRYAIGDSVMLGAKSALRAHGFRVDAIESRQAYKGPALVRSVAQLPANVVVHLGTNGTFPLSTCKAIVRAAGPDRRVFLVTDHAPRSWVRSNNAVMRECDRAFAGDRVTVIDWNGLASRNRNWLYADGIHLKPQGAKAFALMIARAVDDTVRAATEARKQALTQASGSGTAALVP